MGGLSAALESSELSNMMARGPTIRWAPYLVAKGVLPIPGVYFNAFIVADNTSRVNLGLCTPLLPSNLTWR